MQQEEVNKDSTLLGSPQLTNDMYSQEKTIGEYFDTIKQRKKCVRGPHKSSSQRENFTQSWEPST